MTSTSRVPSHSCVALSALVLAGTMLAATQEPIPMTDRRFRAGVDVITVTATVVDATGRLVTGLPRDAFQVLDDGQKQDVSLFTSDRVPVSVGLLLDTSDSMRGQRIIDARAAVGRFLGDLLHADDEFFVMSFSHKWTLLAPWTAGAGEAATALAAADATGGTAVYDAVLAALPMMEDRSRQRAALVVISDGADTASDASVRDVRSALYRSAAFVYAIAIDPPVTRAINTRVNVDTLRDITDYGGGRTLVVHDTSELAEATESIATELNGQYLLGYDAPHRRDATFHTIRVTVNVPQLKVRARRGYVAADAPHSKKD